MLKLLPTLSLASACGFHVILFGTHRKCHSAMVSYCFDIPKGKNISGVKHGCTLFPCIWSLIRKKDLCNLTKSTRRLEAAIEVTYD